MSDSTYDELLDHEYDGIREYDNPTPGWWHLIFWASILVCFPYVLFWHFSPMGWSEHEGYDASVAAYYRAQFAKFGDLTADEATIAGLMANENYMNSVAGTFIGKCASCHGQDGKGLVGPNLTDDAYINVKSLPDIYKTINEGVTLKGMPAWGRQLPNTEVVLLSAYVASLRGSGDGGGKAPEGEIAAPWPEAEPLVFETETAEAGAE